MSSRVYSIQSESLFEAAAKSHSSWHSMMTRVGSNVSSRAWWKLPQISVDTHAIATCVYSQRKRSTRWKRCGCIKKIERNSLSDVIIVGWFIEISGEWQWERSSKRCPHIHGRRRSAEIETIRSSIWGTVVVWLTLRWLIVSGLPSSRDGVISVDNMMT